MVEAVVVIPTLLILFAAMVFTWRLYGEKIRVTGDARSTAWSYAVSNCGDPGDPGPEDDTTIGSGATKARGMGNGENGAPPADLAQAEHVTRNSPADVHANTMVKDLDTAVASAQAAVIPSPFLGLRSNVPVSTSRSVLCNEPPYNASLPNMIKAAFENLK
jgi:hypothetical protein